MTGNFSYTPNKVTKYKGKYSAGYNDAGEWSSNLGEVASSTSAVNPVIEGNIKGEYYLKILIKELVKDLLQTELTVVRSMV